MACFCGCEDYVKNSDGFKVGCVKCNHGPQNHEESFKIKPITEGTQKRGSLSQLFSYYFHKHMIWSISIKLFEEDLFPRSKIKAAMCYSNHNFPSHDLPLEVCVCVIFSYFVVFVSLYWLVRSQFFKPPFIVLMRATFIVVDKYAGRDMHCINQAQSLFYLALLY